jgi:aminocarboxymuconate-semialdehyde decarboxylase
MKKIDTHAHFIFPETIGKAGEYGPEIFPKDGRSWLRVGAYQTRLPDNFAANLENRHSADGLIADIDRNGIDMLNLMVSPILYFYWAPLEIALGFCALQNDLLAKLSATHPDRLFWSATLPMQDPVEALSEAKRAVGLGAKCISLGTGDLGGGRGLDSEDFWPLYDYLQRRSIPILLHPYPNTIGGEEDRYKLSFVVGFAWQETHAFATLTLGGVLDTFPKLKFSISHGGGYVPYQFGRIVGAYNTKIPGVKAKRPIEEYLANFWFDTTVHDQRALRYLYEFMGADQLLVGSNYAAWNWHDEFSEIEALGIPQEDQAKIFHRNAEYVFNLS